MSLEVLIATMNLDKKDLDKMNIKSPSIVINQTNNTKITKYKNFTIYNYNEKGAAKSRNRALDHATADIILFSDDDVVYNDNFDKEIIKSFNDNPKADMIIFNVINPYRHKRINTKTKRLHIYNSLNYAFYNIAVKRCKIKDIKVNELFGAGATYKGGDDSLFIVDCLKQKLKIYSSPIEIGHIGKNESTWFKGFNEKYFFNKGACFTAINKYLKHILFLQHLLRHKYEYKEIGFSNAYKNMIKGSKDYLKRIKQ